MDCGVCSFPYAVWVVLVGLGVGVMVSLIGREWAWWEVVSYGLVWGMCGIERQVVHVVVNLVWVAGGNSTGHVYCWLDIVMVHYMMVTLLKRNIVRCYSDLKPNVPLRNCIGSLRSQDLCK